MITQDKHCQKSDQTLHDYKQEAIHECKKPLQPISQEDYNTDVNREEENLNMVTQPIIQSNLRIIEPTENLSLVEKHGMDREERLAAALEIFRTFSYEELLEFKEIFERVGDDETEQDLPNSPESTGQDVAS
jgi:hypothetical protein